MSKKKHPEHVNHERWLVSYADFITLLFAFFVVLFASSQADKRKTVRLAQAMQTAFTHNGIFDQHSRTPPLTEQPGTAQATEPAPIVLPLPSAAAEARLKARIQQAIARQAQARQGSAAAVSVRSAAAVSVRSAAAVSVRSSADGLVVSLREAGFFASGSAELRVEAIPTLNAVADALPHQAMRVEGHTDDVPIHTAQFATNWELSTARAATITRLLLARHAAEPSHIAAAGYAEFQPTVSNATASGRAENRRVDIVLLAEKAVTTPDAAHAPADTRSLPGSAGQGQPSRSPDFIELRGQR